MRGDVSPDELTEVTEEARRWLVGCRVLSVSDYNIRFDTDAGPLLHVAGTGDRLAGREAHAVAEAFVSASGELQLGWDDGLSSVIEPQAEIEGWDLWADGMTRLVCVPGGEVWKFLPVDPDEPVPDRLRGLMETD